jgi:class 3 adenylate cyclase
VAAASAANWWGALDSVQEHLETNIPGSASDEKFVRQMASYLRLCASPTTFTKVSELQLAIDVRGALPTIRAPTLVTHIDQPGPPGSDDILARPVEASRYVAERIAHARLVELTPGDPYLWAVDQSQFLALLREFLTGAWEAGAWEAGEPDRVLATLLFTDIVSSTERAAELGDAGWRDLVQRHHALVRQELVRFRGRELDTAGDGFFASFDGPARAVRCACAIAERVPELGIDIRAGLHAGECELIDGKMAGLAVHIGARVAAAATPGQVLVSSTVKDLVAGSGIAFEERGEHELKGIPGIWTLHAAVTAKTQQTAPA